MTIQNDPELLAIVKATGEVYGKQVSVAAAVMFLGDLENYKPNQIRRALQRCRRELKSFPSVADVIARIEDGRPGVEEAWAALPRSEADSCVWTDEMAEAYGACRTLMESDPIAARMTFKEVYLLTVAKSREEGRPVNWQVSMGHDPQHRVAVMMEAVSKHRITLEHAQRHIPELSSPASNEAKSPPLLGGLVQLADIVKRIENYKESKNGSSENGEAGSQSGTDGEKMDSSPENGNGGSGA